MTEAIIFNGMNSLDFQDIRSSVTRIPEVIQRIREAQDIWDFIQETHFDLLNFICSDNKTFFSNIHLKSLACAVVQVGLYDRYLRFQKEPQFLVGNINGDSALKVAAGVMSFEFMVKQSANVLNKAPNIQEALSESVVGDPKLSGISLTEYAVFQKNSEQKYQKMDSSRVSVTQITHLLIENYGLKKVVSIGPGNQLVNRKEDDLILEDLQILESIDLDPMLSWFWSGLKESLSA